MKKRQEVYDLYWYFACERQNIFWKKLNGEEAPWTDDDILQTYKFCNSYRVNDRVSQYLLKNVIYNGKKYKDEDMIFTYQALCFAQIVSQCDKALYYRRYRKNSIMTSSKTKKHLLYTVFSEF